MRDFTLQQYQSLCETVIALNRPVLRFVDYFRAKTVTPFAMLRHDVDRWPANALAMAKLEHQLGLRSSYYFRHTPHGFKPRIMKDIAAMGHEVGFHYETLATTRGDHQAALALFAQQLAAMRVHVDIQTVCMHGSPLSPHNNRDLWHHARPQDFGLLGEIYLDIDYQRIAYFTDTGRCWNSSAGNLRDYCDGAVHYDVATTPQLIQKLPTLAEPVIVQTHPERWNAVTWKYALYYAIDTAALVAKKFLHLMRNV